MGENNKNTVENINTNEEILQFLIVMPSDIGNLSSIIKDVITWRDQVESLCHYEDQNNAVSLHGVRKVPFPLNEEMEPPLKKAKTGASRGPADILPSTSKASQRQDESPSSQEIPRQTEDDIQSVVGQIVCNQRKKSYSFDSFDRCILKRPKSWLTSSRKTSQYHQETFFDKKTKEKIRQLQQKHL